MKVAVFGKTFKPEVSMYILKLFETLERNNLEVLIYEPFYNFLSKSVKLNLFFGTYNSYEDLQLNFDFFISIGGDGTILDATTFIRDIGIPIIGVNTGRLGFLADTAKEDIDNTIKQIINNQYRLDERTLLNLNTDYKIFDDVNFALNEVTIWE